MKAFNHIELTTVDLNSELRFSVVHHAGWVDGIVLPTLVAVVFYMAWTHPNALTHLFSFRVAWPLVPAVLSLLALLMNWMQGRSTELRVTSSELAATGNIGKLFSSEVRVAASEVKSLGFRAGSHGRQGGLFVRRGWRNICLLPGLNAKQAGAVARTVYRRFPDIGEEDHNPDSLLFGKESDLTALGLTGAQRENQSMRWRRVNRLPDARESAALRSLRRRLRILNPSSW